MEADKDWQRARAADVEQFSAWQLRERQVSVAIVTRRMSALSSFYRWALKHEIVERDPVALADKPKRPLRMPVWLEREEQAHLEATLKDRNNLPRTLFGQPPERMTATRHRYELLFGLLLNSGLRISEALGLKVADVRLVDGIAKSAMIQRQGQGEFQPFQGTKVQGFDPVIGFKNSEKILISCEFRIIILCKLTA